MPLPKDVYDDPAAFLKGVQNEGVTRYVAMIKMDELMDMLQPCTETKCDISFQTKCLDLSPMLGPMAVASNAANKRCTDQELIDSWYRMCPVVSRLKKKFRGIRFIAAINDVLFLMCKYNRMAGDIFYGLYDGLQYVSPTKKKPPRKTRGEINCVAVCVWNLIMNAMAGNTAWTSSHVMDERCKPVVAAESEDHIFIVVLSGPSVLQDLRDGAVFVKNPANDITAVYEATVGWLFEVDTWNKIFPDNSLQFYGMHWVLDVEALRYTHFTSCNTICVQRNHNNCKEHALYGNIHDSVDPLFRLQHVYNAIATSKGDRVIVLALEHAVECIKEGMQNTYARVCHAIAKELHAAHKRSRIGVRAMGLLARCCETGLRNYPNAPNRNSHHYLRLALELCS